MELNSSMQQTPPSASTRAPASKCHSPPSRTADTVRPAFVEPTPVVSTERGASLEAYLSNCSSTLTLSMVTVVQSLWDDIKILELQKDWDI